MKTPFMILILGAALVTHGLADEAAEKKLAAEYQKRKAAAAAPINDWYAKELEKLLEGAMKSGDFVAATKIQQQAMAAKLCGKEWLFCQGNNEVPFTFLANGTASHKFTSYKWEATSLMSVKLISDRNDEINISMNPTGTNLSGRGSGPPLTIKLVTK